MTEQATIERQLEYLRQAMRELLDLPADAPDEDIIDVAAERLSNVKRSINTN